MSPVTASSEVMEGIQRVKAGAAAFCTNFFPVQKKLEAWIENGELWFETRKDAAFFLRRDRDFWHLFFCAADESALRRELGGLRELKSQLVAIDLVGNEVALGGMIGVLEDAGFRRRSRLQRMARANQPHQFSTAAVGTRVVRAEKTEGRAALDLLDGTFDRFADQLPTLYEIEAALETGQVLAVKADGNLAALLYFETQGFATTIRYWAVAEAYRDRGFGSALMREYLESHAAARRFTLWVVSENKNAVKKYEHYGYAADGLIDHVLTNAMIPA